MSIDEAPEPIPIIPDVPRALSPLVRRICADNPGVMTGPGTNSYIVGTDALALIDPGPEIELHIEALLRLVGTKLRWVLCTHMHHDHSPAAHAIHAATRAQLIGMPPPNHSRHDTRYVPQRVLQDGERFEGQDFTLRAIHTPGHASNHLCFLLEQERMLFSGDHIMEGSTVVIRPPDGDMAAYLQQLERLKALRPRLKSIAPGHGHLIDKPAAKIDDYLQHRAMREGQVLELLEASGPVKVDDIVAKLYTDIPEDLVPMAAGTVWAHLLKLKSEGRAKGTSPDKSWSAA